MRANDVLNKLGITRQTLTKWVKEKKISVHQLINGHYVYDAGDVYRILLQNQQKNKIDDKEVYKYLSKRQSDKLSKFPKKVYGQVKDNYKKIVIDVGNGEFKLSERAINLLSAIKECDKDNLNIDMREDSDLIYVIDKLGSEANSEGSKLSVVEVNPNTTYIIKKRSDGKEYIDFETSKDGKTIDDYIDYMDKYQYLDKDDDGFENEFFEEHKSIFLNSLEGKIKIEEEKTIMDEIEDDIELKNIYNDFMDVFKRLVEYKRKDTN